MYLQCIRLRINHQFFISFLRAYVTRCSRCCFRGIFPRPYNRLSMFVRGDIQRLRIVCGSHQFCKKQPVNCASRLRFSKHIPAYSQSIHAAEQFSKIHGHCHSRHCFRVASRLIAFYPVAVYSGFSGITQEQADRMTRPRSSSRGPAQCKCLSYSYIPPAAACVNNVPHMPHERRQ